MQNPPMNLLNTIGSHKLSLVKFKIYSGLNNYMEDVGNMDIVFLTQQSDGLMTNMFINC